MPPGSSPEDAPPQTSQGNTLRALVGRLGACGFWLGRCLLGRLVDRLHGFCRFLGVRRGFYRPDRACLFSVGLGEAGHDLAQFGAAGLFLFELPA
jgi:hypothetical protein